METPNLTAENVEKIEKLFPNCVKESQDEEWNLVKKIDFDLLKVELWDKSSVEWLDERYRLDWPGKKRSILKANTPITKTLRPVKEKSVNWENTGNLYIEWDNFEVLKILQESYLWKIKCIYIDPPYNTWNDFLYDDDFSETTEKYKEMTEENEEWYKMFRNTETNWKFHSDWLSMMYERLKIARDLLREDWVIFMSIDDGEKDNLKKIWDEIFWENNFIASVPRVAKTTSFKWNYFAPSKDYLVVFAKNIETLPHFVDEVDDSQFKKIESEWPRKWEKYRDDIAFYLSTLDITRWSYSQRYRIECPDWSKVIPPWKTFPPEKWVAWDWVWRWTPETYKAKKDYIVFKQTNRSPLLDENWNQAKRNLYTKSYLKDKEDSWNVPRDFWDWFLNRNWSERLKKLWIPFDYAKPCELLKYIFKIIDLDEDSLVLDFFSWSWTTADALLQYNAENWWNRKFIMIQIAEKIEENTKAFNEWYRTICDIWEERIRRVWNKINKEINANIDCWFRVYRVDESCMKDVYYHPSEAKQENLWFFTSNIREDRTPEDLLTQVILNFWLTLDLPIEEKKIKWNKVFYVAWNSLVACFDDNLDFSIVDEIAKDQPIKLVFRDACFWNDADRINVENKVKRLSPETNIKVI